MSKIKFIKSLEKVSDDVWLYTPGALVMADGRLNEHRKWIQLCSVGWSVHQSNPRTIHPSEVDDAGRVYPNLYEACTGILQWFWELCDYKNDPERLARLEEDRAKGVGPIPELVISFQSGEIFRAAEQQFKAKELSQ